MPPNPVQHTEAVDVEADAFPDTKAHDTFAQHMVGPDGEPNDDGVAAHAPANIDDHQQVAACTSAATPKPYGHISRAIYERPWAIQPQMLAFIADLVAFRQKGARLSAGEIADRLAGARAQNGERAGAAKAGSVAIIPMYGPLSQRMSLLADSSGGTSVDALRDSLHAALADKSVSAVVFDIDSPGGATDGVPEFAAELRSLRGGAKPIVGVVNTLAASAAYWLAANMSELVVTPSGEVGSIGVFAMHADWSRADELAGVKTTLISAGQPATRRRRLRCADAAYFGQGRNLRRIGHPRDDSPCDAA